MINGDPLWHVSAIKLWANWSSFNKINGHMVPSILLSFQLMHIKKSRNYHFKVLIFTFCKILTIKIEIQKTSFYRFYFFLKFYDYNKHMCGQI